MKPYTKLGIRLLLGGLVVFGVAANGLAQTTEPQPQPEQGQPQNPNVQNQETDLRFLGLTQDQVRKIRIINAELKDQRQEATMRLRLARRALAEAVESPTPDETLISQRSRELAEAQANTIRLRSLTEARILQVLTPEQRARIRLVRQQNQAMRAGQGRPNAMAPRRRPNNSLVGPGQRRPQPQPPRQ
jgi:Spy/CpxP family protein refolding chaperone